MNIVTTMPTSGQFVAVWEYAGVLWSETYRVEGTRLFVYNVEEDDFEPECLLSGAEWPERSNLRFIVSN